METFKKLQNSNRGLALIVALITATVTLAVGLSLLNVTLRQFVLSNVAKDSEVSFHAAYAGIECTRFQDVANNVYDVPRSAGGTVSCMGVSAANPGGSAGNAQSFEYNWGTSDSPACTKVDIYKFNGGQTIPGSLTGGSSLSCPSDNVCTVSQSRGYNVDCSLIGTTRTVERQVILIY